MSHEVVRDGVIGTGVTGTAAEVPSGPFEAEPVDLGRVLSDGFSPAVAGDEVVRRCERWLTGVLDEADVAVGSFDAEVAALLAADGWSVAQVVAGWVRRAAAR